jgi:hypothetical protein
VRADGGLGVHVGHRRCGRATRVRVNDTAGEALHRFRCACSRWGRGDTSGRSVSSDVEWFVSARLRWHSLDSPGAGGLVWGLVGGDSAAIWVERASGWDMRKMHTM